METTNPAPPPVAPGSFVAVLPGCCYLTGRSLVTSNQPADRSCCAPDLGSPLNDRNVAGATGIPVPPCQSAMALPAPSTPVCFRPGTPPCAKPAYSHVGSAGASPVSTALIRGSSRVSYRSAAAAPSVVLAQPYGGS